MVKHAAKMVRENLGYEMPILVRMDGGFMDGELFWRLDVNQIGFVCTMHQSRAIKAFAGDQTATEWRSFSNGKQVWPYLDFGTRRLKWSRLDGPLKGYLAISIKSAPSIPNSILPQADAEEHNPHPFK